MAFKNLLRFVLKIFFSKRQVVVAIIMYGALSSVLLFFLFFKTFESYYIAELKSIYPTIYIVTDKKIQVDKFENTKALTEIFELDWSDFVIGIDKEKFYSLGSVGMRSFHKEYLPKILTDSYIDENTIYVSNTVYTLLKSQQNFTDKFFIESDINGRIHSFNVKSFDLHDEAKWIMMSDEVSHKLYRDGNFDKVVFYSNKSDEELHDLLIAYFKQPVFTWDNHISLSSRALKESMVYIFLLLTFAIIVLVIASFVFFAQSILDDLVQITRFAFFHGIENLKIFLMYFFIINFYLISIYTFSFLSASYINSTFIDIIWGFEAQNYISILYLSMVVETLIISLLWIYVYISQKSVGSRMSRV